MKKEVFSFSFIFCMITLPLMFASCEKEEPGPDKDINVVQEDKTKSLSKGFYFDSRELGHEYKEATYKDNTNYKYRTLKVYRKSEPGKYFYVMLDNLSIPQETGCWAYDNKWSNADKYGFLYTWETAKALAKRITMELPVLNQNGETIIAKASTPGRIMNCQDLYDLIEEDMLSNVLSESKDGYTISEEWEKFENFYYDEFVVGTDYADCDYSAANHTLAGGRYYGGTNGEWYFEGLNEEGHYWTNDYYQSPNAHRVFVIKRKDSYWKTEFDLKAYIRNAIIENECGLSVRLVFEPRVVNR